MVAQSGRMGAEHDDDVLNDALPPPPPPGPLPPVAREEPGDPQKPQRKGSRIFISGFSGLGLEAWDADGDGTIDAAELAALLKSKKHGDKIKKGQAVALGLMSVIVVACAITLGVLLGQQGSQTRDELSRHVTKQSNETRASIRGEIHDQRLGSADQAEPLPSEWAVEENATRPSLLVDRNGNPIRVDQSRDQLKLSSALPDKVLGELEQLVIAGPTGRIQAKTTGFGRYETLSSKHGSVVVIYTQLGNVKLDGEDMTLDESIAGVLSGSGAGFNITSETRFNNISSEATFDNITSGTTNRTRRRIADSRLSLFDEHNVVSKELAIVFGSFSLTFGFRGRG